MKKNLLLIYKKIGETPLAALKRLRHTQPTYAQTKLAYAGRLDPMAEGLLLVLVGDECKNRETYQKLDKVYECEVLCGISTDTYDVLGVMTDFRKQQIVITQEKLQTVLENLQGTWEQAYPPYSAVRVKGRSLFAWARENKLHEVVIPKKKIQIHDIEILQEGYISGKDLLFKVDKRLELVTGDFRQGEIKKSWQEFFAAAKDMQFPVVTLRVVCSSGTYMRSLAYEIGKQLGVPSLALSIKRTRIGPYTLDARH